MTSHPSAFLQTDGKGRAKIMSAQSRGRSYVAQAAAIEPENIALPPCANSL